MLEGYYARLTTRVERGGNIIPNIGNIGRIIRLEIIDFKIYFIIEFAAPFISTSGFLVAPSEWDDKRAEEFKREMGLLGYIILPEGESTFNCALLTNEFETMSPEEHEEWQNITKHQMRMRVRDIVKNIRQRDEEK